MKMTAGECAQGKYYVSDITGTYLQTSGGPFAGGKKTPMPNYRSVSVVVSTPQKGVYFLRLTGPEKTIAAAADAFSKIVWRRCVERSGIRDEIGLSSNGERSSA